MFAPTLNGGSLDSAMFMAHDILKKKATLEQEKKKKKKTRSAPATRKKLSTSAASTSGSTTQSPLPPKSTTTTSLHALKRASANSANASASTDHHSLGSRPTTIRAGSGRSVLQPDEVSVLSDGSAGNPTTTSTTTATTTKSKSKIITTTTPTIPAATSVANTSFHTATTATASRSTTTTTANNSNLKNNHNNSNDDLSLNGSSNHSRSDFYFQHSIAVDTIWQKIKSTVSDYETKIGEQIVLRLLELNATARQTMRLTSLRSKRFDELTKLLVVVVDLMVSVFGPDLDLYADDLEALGRQCVDHGIPMPLLSQAVPEALKLALLAEDENAANGNNDDGDDDAKSQSSQAAVKIDFTEEDWESWAVVVETVGHEMQVMA
ncbi:hypothetical protein ACA910_015406 [Epithemia clementina (nom. ined.)]